MRNSEHDTIILALCLCLGLPPADGAGETAGAEASAAPMGSSWSRSWWSS
ncbi:MAG: hypothetical protein ACLUEK_03500 [Oscillospiraceae bacterium]